MERDDMDTGEIINTRPHPYFHSKNEVILATTDLEEVYDNAVERIKEEIANFQRKGSGWRFKSVIRFDIHTTGYKPMRGNSYFPLPKKLKNKKAIINPQNVDEECFKWCITRALNPVKDHPERITKELREQAEQLNWSGISFPASLCDTDTFEKNNDGISVNVFGYEDWGSKIYPLRLTEDEDAIDLLLISDDENNHYCWIKEFNRLLGRDGKPRYFCKRCMNGFTRPDALTNHRTCLLYTSDAADE